jgi:hypothetical protein
VLLGWQGWRSIRCPRQGSADDGTKAGDSGNTIFGSAITMLSCLEATGSSDKAHGQGRGGKRGGSEN